jgi:hypothetical protein
MRIGVMADPEQETGNSMRGLIAAGFGKSFWGFAGLAVIAGIACYAVLGRAAFFEAAQGEVDMIASTIPRIVVALGVAGLFWVLLPRDRLARHVGAESGFRGLVIAALGGIVTPGGPASAFSLLTVLGAGGADRGAMVTYITSWSMLGLQRILVWDVPFMGAEFSITRFLVCLPLPIIAGMIARRLPLEMRITGLDSAGKARQ